MKTGYIIMAFIAFHAVATALVKAGGNLALFATPSTSYVSGHETLEAINDGFDPVAVDDHSHGCYGNWPKSGTQWVQYAWEQPISTRQMDVYWWDDARGVRLPAACRLFYWTNGHFLPVPQVQGLGVAGGQYNTTTFAEIATTRLRMEFDSSQTFSTGIIEWKVYDSGISPKFAPHAIAGPDRVVVLPAKSYLNGETRGGAQSIRWSQAAGPGTIMFADATQLKTTATFSKPGDYVVKLSAFNGDQSGSATLRVQVESSAPKTRLEPVAVQRYQINSPLWSARLKQQIVHWIPHCIAELAKPGLPEGGLENFIEAANKNAGRPHKPHFGPPWANAYTLNVIESMCLALELDARGDTEVVQAQTAIRSRLDEWVSIVLAAQEPDGYLQTRFTLGKSSEQKQPPPRWTYVGDHEGYVAGYFIEAAIAHYRLEQGHDRRMYDAARKLADCWDAHIGPAPKQAWHDGHEELEQALVRLGRLVNQVEGGRQGDRYFRLARFLLDNRRKGDSYDQTHLPVIQQYEALGHAVRAAYCYSAMADIAMETGDAEYHSAVKSLWNSIVNRKYYVTGGIGSGETSEGFGQDFSLPNNAYCESCADCGEIFFQHKMNLAYHEARYADLMEETLYNAVLGSVDLAAGQFTYVNPLDQDFARYGWHGCPCCVGNIPRTLLELPTWMYAKDADGLFVNLYIGSTIDLGRVAGTDVTIEQHTDYPWQGAIELTIKPATAKKFSIRLRAPNRNVSALYQATPTADGIRSLSVNGHKITPDIKAGYAVITRQWKPGDRIQLELPLCVQRVSADQRVTADRGLVALRYGPMIYNLESVDQPVDGQLNADTPLTTEWQPDLLGGVVVIHSRFANGSSLTAIPNFARNNRGGRSVVWFPAGHMDSKAKP